MLLGWLPSMIGAALERAILGAELPSLLVVLAAFQACRHRLSALQLAAHKCPLNLPRCRLPF